MMLLGPQILPRRTAQVQIAGKAEDAAVDVSQFATQRDRDPTGRLERVGSDCAHGID